MAEAETPLARSNGKEDVVMTGTDPEEYFEITKERLGKGAYGTVLKAISKKDKTVVAMKIMNIKKDDHKGLKEELKILSGVSGPRTVKYFGSFIQSSKFFIAMEYCSAGSIMDLMNVCKMTLTESEISVVMKHALEGIAFLHNRKVIHRDIKAANLLLSESGDCKLADFGVSKKMAHTLATTKTMIGTPYWMAPEVVGHRVDSKSRKKNGYNTKADIWSLGITAIECAQGRPPLHKVYPMKAIFLIPKNPPPTLDEDDDWSDNFKSFVGKCLQKESNSRPTAVDLLTHPFVKSAPDKKILADLVKKNLPAIEAARIERSQEASDDNSDSSDENHDSHTGDKTDEIRMSREGSGTLRNDDGNETMRVSSTNAREPEYMAHHIE